MTAALHDPASSALSPSTSPPPGPRPAITLEQRYFFEANGYLVVREALSPGELARVRAAADAAEARWRARPDLPGVRRHDLDQVIGIMDYDPVFLELLEHRTVFPLVRELLGPDLMMLDNDYFITPPGALIHRGWHYDEGFPGIYHPRSRLMVKVFYVLADVPHDGGATVMLPGSHCFAMARPVNTEVPEEMPAAVRMDLPAGAAYLMAGRTYHCVGNNHSGQARRLLIYTYGHKWMRTWDGYEPSPWLAAQATTPMRRQLLGLTDPYGPNAAPDDLPAPGGGGPGGEADGAAGGGADGGTG